MEKTIRINRYLAERGETTRRGADELIKAGRVTINGRVAKLGEQIKASDRVVIQISSPPKPHTLIPKTYFFFASHNPRGEPTRERYSINGQSRLAGGQALFPIGRLDRDSRGLLILTNDGRLTKKLLTPTSGREKEYEVRVDKPLKSPVLKALARGVWLEGKSGRGRTRPAAAEILDRYTFKIILTEGRRHQIRRMLAALGYQVRDLCRVRVGSIKLAGLAAGQSRPLRPEELI